jgi:hypothetical protein
VWNKLRFRYSVRSFVLSNILIMAFLLYSGQFNEKMESAVAFWVLVVVTFLFAFVSKLSFYQSFIGMYVPLKKSLNTWERVIQVTVYCILGLLLLVVIYNHDFTMSIVFIMFILVEVLNQVTLDFDNYEE